MTSNKRILVCVGLAVTLGCFGWGTVSEAADHRDSPLTSNGPFDINDIYAFQSPQRPENVVFIMTVNPNAGGGISPSEFGSRGVYELNIDTNADAIPNFAFRVYFSAARGGSQRFIVVQANGQPLVSGQTGKITSIRGGGFVTAGLFDDPFFFDNRVLGTPSQTGTDFFAGTNVTAIVLEVPSAMFGAGNNNISVYGRTLNGSRQFDRMGRPAINTVLIVGTARKEAFNKARPQQDFALFGTEVTARLTALAGLAQPDAAINGPDGLVHTLLPDVLTIDTNSTAGFLNGRQLADDVIDAELNLLTRGGLTTDGVPANDKAFLSNFPYLAAPHVLAQ